MLPTRQKFPCQERAELNLSGNSIAISLITKQILGVSQNIFQKKSLKRVINQNSGSGIDIVPCISDSAGDDAH